MNATTNNAVRNYLNVLRHSQIHPSSLYFSLFAEKKQGRRSKMSCNVITTSLREADFVRTV